MRGRVIWSKDRRIGQCVNSNGRLTAILIYHRHGHEDRYYLKHLKIKPRRFGLQFHAVDENNRCQSQWILTPWYVRRLIDEFQRVLEGN